MARATLCFGVVLLSITAVAHAQEPPADRMDIEGFGRLPVRFNSRVTTLSIVAQNTVLKFTGRPVLLAADGGELDPVRWFLDLAAGRPEALEVPILRVEGEELQRLLLPDAEPGKSALIGATEFSRSRDRLLPLVRRASERNYPDRTEEDERVLGLFGDEQDLSELAAALEVARAGAASRAIEFDRQGRHSRVPLCVPPEAAGAAWRTLCRASLDALGGGVQRERQAVPIAKAVVEIVRAYASRDTASFDRRLGEYRALLEKSGTAESPLRYAAPRAWIEIGVPSVLEEWFYGDAGARGIPIALFHIREGEAIAWASVNHFPRGLPDETRLINQWRLQHGMPPLDPAGVERTRRPFPVGPLEGKRVDLTTPGTLPIEQTTTVSVSLTHPGGATEISIYGPVPLVRKHVREFESFAASFRFGEEPALRAWLAAEPGVPSPTFEGSTFLGAVRPAFGRLWAFRASCLSECAAKLRERFDLLVRGAEFPFWSRDQIRLELPEGMRREKGRGPVFAEIVADAPPDAPGHEHRITVEPIATEDAACIPRIVNLWRGYLGLAPASESELAEMIRPIDPEDEAAGVFVEFSGPERVPPKPASPEPPGIDFDVPPGWRAVEPGALKLASLTYEDGGRQLELAVFRLPGTAGGLYANAVRFRSQVGIDEPLPREEFDRDLRPVLVLGRPGQAFEAVGEDLAVLAAFAPDADATWVVRMKGPRDLALGQRAAFEKFLGSLRFKDR